MPTFWGFITAATLVGGLPAVSGIWLFERRRALRRNRNGECAVCGTPWHATRSVEPYVIHGRLTCEPCARNARRRMPWHLAALTAAAALATSLAAAGSGAMTVVLLPMSSTLAMTAAAVHLMKRANRTAQRRIAAGEYPDITPLLP